MWSFAETAENQIPNGAIPITDITKRGDNSLSTSMQSYKSLLQDMYNGKYVLNILNENEEKIRNLDTALSSLSLTVYTALWSFFAQSNKKKLVNNELRHPWLNRGGSVEWNNAMMMLSESLKSKIRKWIPSINNVYHIEEWEEKYVFLSKGEEHLVYLDPEDDSCVYKLKCIIKNEWIDLDLIGTIIEGYVIHACHWPDYRYWLYGVMHYGEEVFLIFKQKKIPTNFRAINPNWYKDSRLVSEILETKYKLRSKDKVSTITSYWNNEHYLSDIRHSNAYFNQDKTDIVVIDGFFHLNTIPDKGGNRKYGNGCYLLKSES